MRLDVRCRLSGNQLTVALRGELDHETAKRLWDFLEPETRNGPATLTIDMLHLRLMDSAGVNVLLKLRMALAARGARLVIWRPRPLVEDLLDLTGFSRTVHIERAERARRPA